MIEYQYAWNRPMTTPIPPEEERFAQILFPSSYERFSDVRTQGTRFVHYTSAAVAKTILHTKEVWMRKSSCMTDYSEVEYGLARLINAYGHTKAGENFKFALNNIFDGITTEIENLFNPWIEHFKSDTYLTCVSEHNETEDSYGRLSMWRAYGGRNGVAIVLNNSAFMNPAPGLGAYSNPVAYLDDSAFEREFAIVAENVQREGSFLKTREREEIVRRTFYMLRLAALCTKHPGFREEREWRVLYAPSLEKSPHLEHAIVTVQDVPQPIYKLPLKDISEISFFGAIPALLNRIIIGPTQYAQVQREAFVRLLLDAGVPDPDAKVVVSNIPLRT